MPLIKGQMFKYSEADMEAAIEECRRGVPTATAARKVGIPRVTLLNKGKGKTPIGRKMGRSCYVTEDIEKIIVTWAKAMVKQGFPIGKDILQDSVKKIVDDLKIETPFKNGRPGKRWYGSFLKRHPDLITRQPQNLTASRASVMKSQISKWFNEVSTYLNDNNIITILNDPKRVFNVDETAFFLNPKGSKVLAARGERSVYQNINTDEKECYTVLLGGNAAGDVPPPMVVFKYERIPRELALSVPTPWSIGRSDNGWMTRETFYEYICNTFHKWLDNNNIPRPVILFIDGHTSHLSYHVSKFCSDNGIILIALFPNATHLLQPMDVAVFRSLKGSWRTAVHSWRLENIDSPILRKVNFCPLSNKVLNETLVPEIFQNGFRKCGLVPWNPDEVCCMLEQREHVSTELTEIQKMAEIKELELGKKFLGKYIETEKIAKFKNCVVWIGPNEDVELFKLYKKVEESLKTLTSSNLVLDLNIAFEISPPLIHTDDMTNDDNIDATLNTPNDDLSEPIELPDKNETTDIISPVMNENNINASDFLGENHETPIKLTENNSYSTTISTSTLMMPSTSKQNMGAIIPSPFKRALFWPTPKENSNKKKMKVKIPSVVSSTLWQQYYEDKEKKKNEIEEGKKKRLEERKKKKQENEEARKLKTAQKLAKKIHKTKKKITKKTDNYSDTSTEEEWQESGDSLDDLSDEQEIENDENEYIDKENYHEKYKLKQGDYVIINFPVKKEFHKLVCIVQKVSRRDIEVMAMVCCDQTKTVFKKNDKDISIVSESQIVEVLNVPSMIIAGDRIKYKFDYPLDVDG